VTAGRRHALLAIGAAAAAAAAALSGSPYLERHATLDIVELTDTVARDGDHVTALELAGWIKNRKPGLRVIDLQPEPDYETFHLPTAESVPLSSLPATRFKPGDTLVLYSDGGGHAAQAWVFLRAMGYKQVYSLRGGLDAWRDEVMSPALEKGASAGRQAEFARVAELSRYFGGTPRVGVDPDMSSPAAAPGRTRPSSSTSPSRASIRRRGC
jgi:rhodanese-related sulfurtransferase